MEVLIEIRKEMARVDKEGEDELVILHEIVIEYINSNLDSEIIICCTFLKKKFRIHGDLLKKSQNWENISPTFLRELIFNFLNNLN